MKRVYTPTQKKTILIIDNDEWVQQLYREKLQRNGFKIEVATGVDRALESMGQNRFDLILLDLFLPGSNSLEVLQRIRAVPSGEPIPIIAFVNAYFGKVVREAEASGTTKCVSKAVTGPTQVMTLVRDLLGVTASSSGDSPAENELRQQMIGTILDGAPQTLAKVRTGYLVLAKMGEENLNSDEVLDMHQRIHSLAGSAGQVGLRKIALLATALEALLIELHAKPKKVTPSVGRTLGQAIDTLASLINVASIPQQEVEDAARILVVDDETISRETICSALGKANLTAVSLADPLAAEHMLETDRFDLIFLDVEMPGRTGLELCVNIREKSANRATPIVFVTAHSDFGTQARSVLSGGNDFIVKPFLLVELAVKALTWLFRKSLTQVQVSAPAAEGSPVEAAATPATDRREPLKLSPDFVLSLQK